MNTLPEEPKAAAAAAGHHRSISSLGDFSLLELSLDHDKDHEAEVEVKDNLEAEPVIPVMSLVVVAETEKVEDKETVLNELVTDISEFDFAVEEGVFKAHNWGGKVSCSLCAACGLDLGASRACGVEDLNSRTRSALEKTPAIIIVTAAILLRVYQARHVVQKVRRQSRHAF